MFILFCEICNFFSVRFGRIMWVWFGSFFRDRMKLLKLCLLKCSRWWIGLIWISYVFRFLSSLCMGLFSEMVVVFRMCDVVFSFGLDMLRNFCGLICVWYSVLF